MKLDHVKKLPRKLKKELKKKFKHRYGHSYNIYNYDKERLIVEYIWFYHNAFKWNMNESLVYKDSKGNRLMFKK